MVFAIELYFPKEIKIYNEEFQKESYNKKDKLLFYLIFGNFQAWNRYKFYFINSTSTSKLRDLLSRFINYSLLRNLSLL